jgi:Holliday junction DNA helicase RuvA
MISFVSGKLVEKTPAYVVVETKGVGFKLWIPLSSYQALGEVGESVCVLTHLHVREDVLQLFGFATPEERDLFQLLISVTGVGPRLAQGILSGISVEEFKQSVRNQDVNMLTSAPGVGKKTAERLVLELREKIGESITEGPLIPRPAVSLAGEEAVLALVSLGYKRTRAQELVQGVLREESSLAVEEVIRRVLRRMSSA